MWTLTNQKVCVKKYVLKYVLIAFLLYKWIETNECFSPFGTLIFVDIECVLNVFPPFPALGRWIAETILN